MSVAGKSIYGLIETLAYDELDAISRRFSSPLAVEFTLASAAKVAEPLKNSTIVEGIFSE